jgi:hypothetical protein
MAIYYTKENISTIPNPSSGSIALGFNLSAQLCSKDENGVITIIIGAAGMPVTEAFYATANQKEFPTSFVPTIYAKVYSNGIRIVDGWSIVLDVLTFTHGREDGEEIIIDQF